jgi:excisionase family DNA binding protein
LSQQANMTKLWKIEELAEYLGVPRPWIYDRTQEHFTERIPHYKLGKYLRFDPQSSEFQEWLRRNFRIAA